MRPAVLTAAILMLFCTLLVAGTTLLAKALGGGALGQSVHPLMVSQARFVFGFAAVALVLGLRKASGRKPWVPGGKPNLPLHMARTFLGWISGAMMFAAAAQMPLADASALSFVSPVATMLFAMPLLGERPGKWRWAAAMIALLGAVVLLRPGAGVIQPAAFLALGAAVTMGLEGITIKKLAVSEPTGRTMLINNAMGAVLASLVAVPFVVWPQTPAHWAALVAMGVVMVMAQILLLNANLRADVSFVAPFFYLTLVWAGVYDILVFDVWPDGVSLIGAAIIVAGGLLMTWRESRGMRAPVLQAPVLGARPPS